MLRTAYDSEGRKYFVEEPLLQSRGPVQTTDADGNLPLSGGFNRGMRQGGYWGGDGGSYFTGYLTGIFLFLIAVLLGGPVLRWSHHLWTPILGRSNNRTGGFWNLAKGLASVVVWVPFYGIVIGLAASLATVFFPGLGNFAPIASSLVFCSLTGAVFQAATGDIHQTPAALATQLSYTERYSGPLLYQSLGLAAVMILSVAMYLRNARGVDHRPAQSELRFWAAALSPVALGIAFWSAGWFLLGSYLLLSGTLFLLHTVSRPGNRVEESRVQRSDGFWINNPND
jgi:hypothetical protein